MFQATCPQCKRVFAVKESQVGTRTTCSYCLEEFVVLRPAEVSQPVRHRPAQTNAGVPPEPASSGPNAADVWADDRRQLEELLNGPVERRETAAARNEPYDFTVACPLCGTRQEATSEQIGRMVRCPDCHSEHQLREPAAKSRRARLRAAEPDDGELRLSEPVPTPVKRARFQRLLDEAPVRPIPAAVPTPADRPRTMTPDEAARDTMSRAQQEVEEQGDDEPPLPADPMKTGVLRFLRSPAMIIRIFFISLGLWLECGAIQAAIHLTDAGPVEQFFSVILRPFSLIFGIVLATNFATSLLAIVQDTALGRDEINSLPGANPADWLFESWPMFASLFAVLLLPAIAAQGIYAASGSVPFAFLTGAIPASILLGTIFPIVLLSFLENGTPFSLAIFRGLQLSARHWSVFVVRGLVLAAVGMALIGGRLALSSGFLSFVLGAGVIVAAMLFFRLLGRLTWVCQVKVAEDQAAREEE